MITLVCHTCGKKYSVKPYRKDESKYCSRKCQGEAAKTRVPWNRGRNSKVELVCNVCGKKHKVFPSKKNTRKYCSRKCCYEAMKDENHLTEEGKKRKHAAIKKWRETPEGQEKFKKFMAAAHKANAERWKNGIHPLQDPEVRARALKTSMDTHRKKFEDGTHPFLSPEIKIKRMSTASRHNYGGTWIEKKVGWLLKEMGLERTPQKPIPYGLDVLGRPKYLFPDFVLPKHSLIVECDGEYWHKDEERQKRRDSVFFEQGYQVLHLTGKEIRNDLASCRLKIENLIM